MHQPNSMPLCSALSTSQQSVLRHKQQRQALAARAIKRVQHDGLRLGALPAILHVSSDISSCQHGRLVAMALACRDVHAVA